MQRMLIAGAALIMATAAMAQSNEKEFDLKLIGPDINIIGEALSELPYKKVVSLMNKLQLQLNAQINKPVVVPEEKKEEKKAE